MDLLFNSPIAITFTIMPPVHCIPIEATPLVDKTLAQIKSEDILKFVTPIKTDPSVEIIKKISSFSYLSNNWDGHGAISLSSNVLNNAIRFISSLPETVLSEVSANSIVPTPYGSIVFDFERGEDLVSVEIGERKIGFFSEFQMSENNSLEGVSFNQENLPIELQKAFNKLYKEDTI
jgi:hypothetical protein